MASTAASPRSTAGGPPRTGGDGVGRWDGDGGSRRSLPAGTSRLGMWLALASISMLFIGLTSAYIVRQGLGGAWQQNALPPLLWFNTGILLASSVTMEQARRRLQRGGGAGEAFRRWLSLTAGLGALFMAGQWIVWRQLAAAGVYLSTNPHSSFFYVLTALHGVHLAGGLIALSFLVWRSSANAAGRGAAWNGARLARWVEVTALYWHFMDGLWIYLAVLLSMGRSMGR